MNTQQATAQVIKFPGAWADVGEQISLIMERYPDVSSYGWHFVCEQEWNFGEQFKEARAHMCTENFARQVAACLEVMGTVQPRGYALRIAQSSSYVLKHQVEFRVSRFGQSDLARYISNGAFIVAAAIEGWEPVRWPNNPNCGFKRGARG